MSSGESTSAADRLRDLALGAGALTVSAAVIGLEVDLVEQSVEAGAALGIYAIPAALVTAALSVYFFKRAFRPNQAQAAH